MDNRDCGLVVIALQVFIETAELFDKEHAFIDDCSRGKRADVGVLGALFELAADNIKSSVKFNAAGCLFRAFDEALHNARHARARRAAQDFRMYRNTAPAEQLETFLLRDDFQHTHREHALHLILRKKQHANAVITLAGQCDAGGGCGCFEKLMRNLRKNSDAVANLSGRVLARAVLEFLHNCQRVVQHLVIRMSVNIYDGSDPAGIVLCEKSLVIFTGPFGSFEIVHSILH